MAPKTRRTLERPAKFSENSTAPLISLRHCSVIYDAHVALDEVSFVLRPGERWVVVGPNGSGKSTLLKVLRGDVWPTPTGRERRNYFFDGEPAADPRGSKHRIAYVGPERQDKYVRYDWNLSVTHIVTTGLFDEDIPLTTPTAVQRRRVERLLRRFRLWSLRDRRMFTLSYGQRRRTLLARALAADPQVLLLDEAFNGLDTASRIILQKTLLRLSRGGLAWVFTTHRLHDLPAAATHFARIEAGQILESGPLDRKALQRSMPSTTGRRKPARGGLATRTRAAGEPLIRLTGIELFRDYRPVLRKFDWEIRRSEQWAIMGPNGSGKSSLLLMLYGDLHPALGGGIERAGMRTGTHIEQWKKRVGYVSPELQAAHFRIGSLEEIVASGRYASIGLNQALTAADRRHARHWLQFFGLADLHARTARQVSYGQLRLALLARAMVNEPELLLLDEPFTGLDPHMHAQVTSQLQTLAESGTQLIMAIHDRQDLVPAVGRVLRIERGGRVVKQILEGAARQKKNL